MIENIILKVSGKPFRCPCGCNVFHHPEGRPLVFECNACEACYIDPDDENIALEAQGVGP